MSKKQTIKNLLVLPLIASAILLANPVLAANQDYTSHNEVRHKTQGSNPKKGVAGTVTSINGSIIIVTTEDGTQYTVDASNATIMKSTGAENTNPAIVTILDIKVGDTIMVRGTIADNEITASKIFDGKFSHRHGKHLHHHF